MTVTRNKVAITCLIVFVLACLLAPVVFFLQKGDKKKLAPSASITNKEAGREPLSVLEKLVADSRRKLILDASDDLRTAKLSQADLGAVVDYLNTHSDYTGYHALFALRRNYPDTYKSLDNHTKASVLSSALKNLEFMNDWGHLTPSDSSGAEAGGAVIEIGKRAIDLLKPLLNDKRPAPCLEFESATLSNFYHYRRADFAHFLISRIAGRPFVFEKDVQKRDLQIEALLRELDKG